MSVAHVLRVGHRASALNRLIAVKLTRSNVDIPTVQMIVPEMEIYCFDKTRVGARAERALADEEDGF